MNPSVVGRWALTGDDKVKLNELEKKKQRMTAQKSILVIEETWTCFHAAFILHLVQYVCSFEYYYNGYMHGTR